MTREQQTLVDLQAETAKLRGSDQDIVNAYAAMFRSVIAAAPAHAGMAFALVGAEMSAQA